ncbi:MAG: DUF5686 and carboxypeptidase regulatory-like domain-containing protein [Gillisia sp.]
MTLKNLFLFSFLLFGFKNYSQVTGKVTDQNNEALPYVNIYTANVEKGTNTNEEGKYQLDITEPGSYEIIFQFLGYKTFHKEIKIQHFPYVLNVSLNSESTNLPEVTVNSKENPAAIIMRQAIAHRQENYAKINQYTADYYSRGLWRMKNVPEKVLGQDVGDFGGGLDSTRSGIIYLSETISKIAFKAPDDFREKIIASKISGNDNGFSLNSAQESNFSFYKNTLDINAKVVSPLADYAFNYYNFLMEGTFYDDYGHLINKIKVIPKRENDRVFYGDIYIVEDSWQLYGVKLQTTGKAIQFDPIETLTFSQNFKYSPQNDFWNKISQTVDFTFKMLGVSGDGRFTAVYSNYDFNPDFDKKSFGNEILSFEKEANKKDSLYWKEIRPIPLTSEELEDYHKKDSIQQLRKSKTYLDSVDAVSNKFSLSNAIFGYTYNDSYNKENLHFSSPLPGTNFNTVQGWNIGELVSFTKHQGENSENYWSVFSKMNYGFNDERFRISGGFQRKFNNFSRPVLTVSGGSETAQINDTNPIPERQNTISTLLFENNYMKIYERSFARLQYGQELFNGFQLYSDFSYQWRQPLYNTTDQTFFDRNNHEFTSNNPLQPQNTGTSAFESDHIFKMELRGKINFDQKYMSYPNMKLHEDSNKYPTLYLSYEGGLGSSLEDGDYSEFRASVTQHIPLGNKGIFSYNFKGGTFVNAEDISFLDYQHFNGNQTFADDAHYLNKFNLLPYYSFSTNKPYFEAHLEHDFQGWILGKIPLLNKLNYNLIAGAKLLTITDKKPYSEYSLGIDNIGLSKFNLFRVDYVVSKYDGQTNSSIVVGIKFLGLLEAN